MEFQSVFFPTPQHPVEAWNRFSGGLHSCPSQASKALCFFCENAVYHWIWYLFQHILKGFILFGHLFNRKWKYNEKIDQHYVEVDESGELTKKYIQTKEEEEVSHTDKPVEFKKLTLDDPAAIDRGSEAEAYAETRDGKPDAEVESQDRFT